MMKPKVFICHRSEDFGKAVHLFSELERAGASPWLAKKNLLLGDDWEWEIKSAVYNADAFIVCLGPDFDKAGFRQQEVRWALEALSRRPPHRGFIIPFIVEPIDALPGWLLGVHAGADLTKASCISDVIQAIEKITQPGLVAEAGGAPTSTDRNSTPVVSLPIAVPDVVEILRALIKTSHPASGADDLDELLSRMLLPQRIVYLDDFLDIENASRIIATMILLTNEDEQRDIHFYLGSPLGVVYAGLGVLDTMQFITAPVATYALSSTVGLSTLLLAAGRKGKRFALEGVTMRIGIRSPSVGLVHAPSDINDPVEREEFEHLRASVHELFARHTGQKLDRIASDAIREVWLTPEDAVSYGIIDAVLPAKSSLPHLAKVLAGQGSLPDTNATT